VCQNPDSTRDFEFSTQAKREQYIKIGELPCLSGFLNNLKDGSGYEFNFILSNGDRSTQGSSEFPRMMHLNVRRVDIYHDFEHIYGFKFVDKTNHLSGILEI
jgi:hypothetical protein